MSFTDLACMPATEMARLIRRKELSPVDSDFVFEDDRGRFHGLDATGVFNLVAPCPALSVPSGFTADGLPTSLPIVGRRHDDVGALNVGKALERQRPWSDRRPPL